jgi:hypothetical protein
MMSPRWGFRTELLLILIGPTVGRLVLKRGVSSTGAGYFAVLESHAEAMFFIPGAKAGETDGAVFVQMMV